MKQLKFRNTVNLAEPKFGSKVIYKTDQFFAIIDCGCQAYPVP